ncbi:MAG TPA: hypothetical protein PLA71_00285 [Saccharofermentans sp.]|nr:hypothetical protein [Saccharofermentans sp.]
MKYEDLCEAILSGALWKAVVTNSTMKFVCKCGFILPKYVGQYAQKCPMCKEPLNYAGRPALVTKNGVDVADYDAPGEDPKKAKTQPEDSAKK